MSGSMEGQWLCKGRWAGNERSNKAGMSNFTNKSQDVKQQAQVRARDDSQCQTQSQSPRKSVVIRQDCSLPEN